MSKVQVLSPYIDDIKKLYEQTKISNEFEFDFNKDKKYINHEKFVSILEYLSQKHARDKNEIQKNNSLDVIYSDLEEKGATSYRLTLNGQLIIEKYTKMLYDRSNHVVMKALMELYNDKKIIDNVELTKKIKQSELMVDITELNMRIRLTEELPFDKKDIKKLLSLNELAHNNIIFRYKQRISLILIEDDKHLIRIDLTDVKMTNKLSMLDKMLSNYELEIELVIKKGPPKTEYLEMMCTTSAILLKILQQSNFILTVSKSENVLTEYGRILSLGKDIGTSLEGRQPISLEVQHATEELMNKYAVTDKADGDRYFLIICANHVYLISQTLQVKDTGIEISKKEYNNTILDGEYIFLPRANRHVYMVFDCLFSKGNDIRKNSNFMERLYIADDVIQACFVLGEQKGYIHSKYDGNNDIKSIETYHTKEFEKFIGALNADIPHEKRYPLIRRKYFIPVYGIKDNEIFKYSLIIWNQYTYGVNAYPYNLDGLIYSPLNQAYITNIKESKQSDYKWKPPEKNSIDFYIQFEKDKITGKPLKVFDNSNEMFFKNKPYCICYLYVGKKYRDIEKPELFRESNNMHVAHLFLKNGEVRDLKDNIIQDNTVVEFYYEINSEMNYKYRWVPIRTRYDKTEQVHRFKKKYGNNSDIANRVWRSIINPILIDDIGQLANDNTYQKQLDKMRKSIGHDIVVSMAKESAYYQIKTTLASPLRNFHNWIKDLMIYTYCYPTYQEGKQQRLLDVGCGRGGDIMKFYFGKALEYVGLDPDNETLNNAVDGAVSRYNQAKKNYPAFFKCTFVCADFTIKLDVDDQIGAIKDSSKRNKEVMEKIFPKGATGLFDRINCQFAFHYFLRDETSWSNTCYNINKCLRNGGYMMLSMFDAHEIIKVLGDNDKYTIYYNDNGEKKVLIDIVKKYKELPKEGKIGVGYPIDVQIATISDVYMTEYLVDKKFLIDELEKRCGMELVDTDMFNAQFEKHRSYMSKAIAFEDNPKTRKFLQNVAEYYNQQDELNRSCFNWTKLCRYYVFRKVDNPIIKEEKETISQHKLKTKAKVKRV